MFPLSRLERGGVDRRLESDVLSSAAGLGQSAGGGGRGDLGEPLPDRVSVCLCVEVDSVGRDEPDGGERHAPAQQAQPGGAGLGQQRALELLQPVQEYEVNQAEDENDLETYCLYLCNLGAPHQTKRNAGLMNFQVTLQKTDGRDPIICSTSSQNLDTP